MVIYFWPQPVDFLLISNVGEDRPMLHSTQIYINQSSLVHYYNGTVAVLRLDNLLCCFVL